MGADVAVSVSSDPSFAKPKILGTSQATGPATLEIRKATYGKGDKMADVTAKVRQAVVSGGLAVKAENALSGGDPAPETPKELRVEFTLNGKDGSMTVPENDMLSIGNAGPWIIDISNGTTARFVRLARTKPGPPLRVNEFRVFGKFE